MPEQILSSQQQHVLMLLAQGTSVADAAAAVGIHRNTVSSWRRTGSPEFRKAWQTAQSGQPDANQVSCALVEDAQSAQSAQSCTSENTPEEDPHVLSNRV